MFIRTLYFILKEYYYPLFKFFNETKLVELLLKETNKINLLLKIYSKNTVHI